MKPLGPTDPQRVGQYRLLGKLGAGGMGSVYLARSDRGRTVAVKLVQPELAAQPEFRQRFQHEVEAARRVGGEWTAPVLGCDTDAETPWVATGYVAGPSLHEVVTTTYGPLPERTLFILANGLVRALRDIHAAGLIHRDLKPSNVMITIDGPRVIDFGIARALEANGEGLTRTGSAVGSPGFMSPEQCRGETLTAASDVFCLGSVLTFAATGQTPFGDANSAMTALMLRIVQGQQDLDGVPDAVRPLIESCLAQDPAERPSLDQLLQFTDIPGDEDEPWLPGALVARLGRHAVELLDSEDPLQAPPLPQSSPPPAMPGTPPVTPLPQSAPMQQSTPPPPFAPPTPTQHATPQPNATPPPPVPGQMDAMATQTSAVPPPGYGTPPPAGYGTPPPAGYGYPQQQQPQAYGYPQGPNPTNPYGATAYPGGPGGPGAGNNNKNRNVLIAAVAAVVAVAIIVGAVVLAGGGGDDPDDDPTTRPTADPTVTEDPTDEPTDDPTDDPVPPNTDGSVPSGMLGAWEGSTSNGLLVRVELSAGGTGETVATAYTLQAAFVDEENEQQPGLLCVETATLSSATDYEITLEAEETTATYPDDISCRPYDEQTLTMSGGSLDWTGSNGTEYNWSTTLDMADMNIGSDGMPVAVYTNTYANSEISATLGNTVSAGETAITWSDNTCEWEAPMVSGGISGTHLVVGPGVSTDPSCESLPPYEVDWTTGADSTADAEAIELTEFGNPSNSFTLNLR
ncbi:serine/threonine-protein kinase [Streptomyces sp. NPDC049881]|uniref:serine/threonine-protein kinase n=1 Tax=Streptomyces sp. NPDC049881 TaxID=3155778 RepID=UPI0034457DB4